MQCDMMILVCHAADGHFANGDRVAVQRVLSWSECITHLNVVGPDRYEIVCADQGGLELHAPGLDGHRTFHRMELYPASVGWTLDMLTLTFELMRAGGFGLMDSLDASRLIVTSPQQVHYFPWLPEPPLLVRDARDLGLTIGQPVI